MKHSETDNIDTSPPNAVIYVAPLLQIPATPELLFAIPLEKQLAENAVWWFLTGSDWSPRDKENLRRQYDRKGWGMFVWKYYRVSRAYVGGYKALAACLKLRST